MYTWRLPSYERPIVIRQGLGQTTWSCRKDPKNPAVLYIDLHLIHEVTTPQAFNLMRERVCRCVGPDLTLATMDHSTPTVPLPSLSGAGSGRGTRGRRTDSRR